MESRLSDATSSSSDEESVENFGSLKRRSSFLYDNDNGSSDDQKSKRSRIDPSYDGKTYYSRESESDTSERRDSFDTSNIQNFYDRSDVENKSNDEYEEKSETSYYRHSISDEGEDATKPESSSQSHENETASNKTQSAAGISNIAARMMKNMGYQQGKGLGRKLQGRAEPVALSTQKGRRGLGLQLNELAQATIEFKPEEEIVEVKEEILWLQNEHRNLPSEEEIMEWKNDREEGPRPETIDGETNFCDEIVVKNIVSSKSVFDRLDKNEMREARTRSNPFETIRGSIFLNRAAVKMANMDRACDFMFTRPSNLSQDELLYFADVCAGPGGFSEYVLWRKKWRAKGFGFTLKNENDFKLHDFHAGPCETFYPYYGPADDGDVYNPENQLALQQLIMSQTDNKGVHFMMADGGFSVEGQENIQEILSKQLYLCQCLVALMIVRDGGHFVTKVFDLFTPFSAGLVYIMYRCFESISIFKPNTSRPANSERYLICRTKKPNIQHIVDYLFKTNKKLCKNDKVNDILELVPTSKLTSEQNFYLYLKESNEDLGHRQVVGLKKIAAYTEDKTLFETRQKVMREDCLKYWEIPDEVRKLPRQVIPTTKVQELLGKLAGILERGSFKDAHKMKEDIFTNTNSFNKHDWLCTPCSAGPDATQMNEDKSTTFYLGTGRSHVYKYDRGHWEQIKMVELPRDTLVYAEMVTEMKREGRSLTRTNGLHILDAYMLGAENVSYKHFSERQKLLQLFCKALWKPADSNNILSPVRTKEWFPIDPNLSQKIELKEKTMKNNSKVPGFFPHVHSYEIDNTDERYYFIPRNVVFFKITDEPWACHWSSSKHKWYYFNKMNRESKWELPKQAIASFDKVIHTRIIWEWPSNPTLSMNDFIKLIEKKDHPAK